MLLLSRTRKIDLNNSIKKKSKYSTTRDHTRTFSLITANSMSLHF